MSEGQDSNVNDARRPRPMSPSRAPLVVSPDGFPATEHGASGQTRNGRTKSDRPDLRLRPLVLGAHRADVERATRSPSLPHRIVLRSRIVLLLATGHSARDAARLLDVSRRTVDLWRARFTDGGFEALLRDKAGRGRKKRSPLAG
jgi:hypothetical protein